VTTACLLAELNRDEVAHLAGAGAVLVLPVGAIEQHGPHLPTWTDALGVEHVATEAVRRLNARSVAGRERALVAPTLPFGASEHHLIFGGTLSLTVDALVTVLRLLGRSAAESGFGRVFLVNGHGGNDEAVRIAARAIARDHEILVASTSWFDLAREEMLAAGGDTLPRIPGHAGAFETSVVLALRPDLVGEPAPRVPPAGAGAAGAPGPLRVEDPTFWRSIDGYTDTPHAADAELGGRLLDVAADALAAAIGQLADRPSP